MRVKESIVVEPDGSKSVLVSFPEHSPHIPFVYHGERCHAKIVKSVPSGNYRKTAFTSPGYTVYVNMEEVNKDYKFNPYAFIAIKESKEMNNVVEKILSGADIRKSLLEGVNDGGLNVGDSVVSVYTDSDGNEIKGKVLKVYTDEPIQNFYKIRWEDNTVKDRVPREELLVDESVLKESSSSKTLGEVLSTFSDLDKICIRDKSGFTFFEGYKRDTEKPVQQRILKKYLDLEVERIEKYKETSIIRIDTEKGIKGSLKESNIDIRFKGAPRGDNWTEFEIELDGKLYDCCMKHFEKGSEWGIDGGKISKLWVKDIETGNVIINYDRGWDIKPKSQAAKEIYDSIIDAHN